MRTLLHVLWMPAAMAAAFLFAGCGGTALPTATTSQAGAAPAAHEATSFTKPALVAFYSFYHALGYWPISSKGGTQLTRISDSLGIIYGDGLAANGNVVIMTNYQPAEVVTYNVKTKAEKTLVDPYEGPFDVAVDKHGTIYAMGHTSVAVLKAGSTPTRLTCPRVDNAQAVAVNNEGDVFLDGYGPASFAGVVEFRAGSTACSVPPLHPTEGYLAGVGVDPKTDDVIVVDDPDFCAGGVEGRMIVYRKPYGKGPSFQRILSTQYCANRFRLDAHSKHIFYADATVSAGFPLIDQAEYPSGKYETQYSNGFSSAASFGGFTTIPNTLPN